MAEYNLPEISQTVVYVLSSMCAIDDKSDSNNIETVKLMNHRHVKCAIIRPKVGEAVRREKGSPFIIS